MAALFAAAFLGIAWRAEAASCTPAPGGLLGWWPADSNANDLTGVNSGVLQGGATAGITTFDGGAFTFDGTNGYVQVPDSPSLRPTNFTIEAWVRFNSLDSAGSGGSPAGDQYIVFRQNSRSTAFEGFALNKTRIAGGDVFSFMVASQAGQSVEIQSATFITTNVWYNIVAVRGTNFTQLYVNGALERQVTVTFAQDYGNFPLYFGTSGEAYWDHKLKGSLDEVSIYSRPLSAGEISAIYAAGASGKCKGLTITTQPQDQNVAIGASAYFSVVASGFGTLAYQWQFNGGSIAGATGTDLTLTNVQPGNAGNYSVAVSNFAGAITSAVAVLTVNTPIACAPPVGGLIGWWPGDGAANDVIAGNNGILQSGASASAPALDGSGFSFDGTNGSVQIPDSPALRPTNLTIEAWVRFNTLDSAGSGGSPAGDQYIVFKQNTRSSDFEGIDLGKTRIGGSDYFQFIVSSASGQSAHLESVTALSAGVWYHVAATRDANSIRLYVNGQPEGQTGVAFPQDYGNFPLFFGTSGQSYWDHKFKGTLDEVSLYDHALSAPEIATIYSAGAGGKCKGATVTAQPRSQSVALGGNALFTVAAAGIAPLRYQWQFNGANIANATGATLALNNIQLSNGGNYGVIVTNPLGSATSAVAVLTVLVPPTIGTQPQSRTNVAGTTATFSASASGSGPLSYQWQFNGGNIAGATDTNLTLAAVQPGDAGNYSVIVTNSVGAATSAVAVLTVLASPVITTQPRSRTNVVGTSASFNVTANGAVPLSYQWQFDGANIGGATGSNLTLANVLASDAGDYSVVISNAAGSVTSAVAVLTVWIPPTITSQPQSRTNLAGTSVSFSAVADGTVPLSYQWQFNSANIPGMTGTSLTLNNAQPGDAGNYAVVVTNVAGSLTSAVAVLTVWVPPSITTQPQSRTNVAGTSAAFNASATGTAPLSYQWQLNGANVAGATGANLTLSNVQASDAGNYSVVVTNVAGSATSAVAVLTVWIPPVITAQPQNQTNTVGTTAAFSLGATGTAPLSYQWQFNNASIAGATGTSLTLSNVQVSDAGSYSVVVTNTAGAVTSAVAVLTVWVPPTIASQPQSRTNVVGTSAGFNVAATGTAPLNYQWQLNGANLAGATGSNLSLGNVQASDAGNYSVVVTNVAGAVTSAVAVLTVWIPPAITAQPQNRTNVVGTTAAFSIGATGTAPLSYQWQFNGGTIVGATATNLTLSNVQASDAGSYSVVVTNIAGSVTSAVAVLTVWVGPAIASQPQSRTNVVGTSAGFNVTATGTGPLNYQWQLNGANIAGATGTSFTLGNVQAADAGNYWVVVTNSAGSITSAVAVLTVLVPPTITVQPQSRTNVAGTSAGFSATANGTGPLSYQWQFNGGNISGATATSLTLTNVQAVDAGSYAMVVTNAAGSVTSAPAILTVIAPPAIATQPQSRTNTVGTLATFGVIATGTAPLSYQWQHSGDNISGASGSSLNLGAVQKGDAGNYTVVITNSAGSVTSAVAVLTIWIPPNVTAQPQGRTNISGTLATFSISADGTAPFSYQWQFNGTNLIGATATSLTLSNVQSTDAGLYSAAVTNVAGSVTSAVATLTIWTPPSITAQPQNRTNVTGTTGTFSTTAGGTAPLSYQWRFNGASLTGATSSVLTLTNIQTIDAGNYDMVVTNVAGATTSGVAVLTVLVPPAISTQPQNCTNGVGTTATFSVSATGTAPLSYQWQFNGTNLPGATTVPLFLTNVQASAAGNFSVIVTNLAGAATSAVATLTVTVPPAIIVQPRSHTNVAYFATAFSAVASGTMPLGYQWRFNGQDIPNAAGPNLILNSPQLTDAGNYTLVVTNSGGAVTSAVATLTLVPSTDCVAAPTGLVSWWAAEGNANDIAGTNNGLVQGGVIVTGAGVVGSDIGFDGTSGLVQIPDASTLKPTNLTVMCWVRFDALDSPGNTPSAGQQFIVFKQNSRTNNFEGFLLSKEREAGGDVLSWDVTSATGQPARVESLTTIIPGIWYHVAGVRGPNFVQIYVNGQLEAMTNVGFAQDYGALPLYLGSSGQPAFDRKLSGALDEVCLFNRALNSSEIAADYFAGLSGKCKAPKILTQPGDITSYWGSSIAFTSGAAGVLPLRYQWRKNGAALLNATNSFLSFSNLQLSDAGSYALQATNSFGTASSYPATLKVNVADVAIRQSSAGGTQRVATLNISGITGRLYGIEASSSLLGGSNVWMGLTNIFLTAAPTTAWFDPQSATLPRRFYRILPGPIGITSGGWETSDIGAVWSDDFNRATLGSNWIVLGGASVTITNNELQFAQVDTDYSRQVYYQPWLTSSDAWTIRWTERFGALDAASFGLGIGIKNFQASGGNDRGYNGLLLGAGPGFGKMQISRFDGAGQQPAASGNSIALSVGDIVDCSLSRSGWTMTATASNRANAQVSVSTLTYSDALNLIAPTISRVCFYPLGGTVYVDNISFSLDHRKPARFIVVGASASDGYNATRPDRRYISVVQSNFFETVCNDSSSYNTTTNSVSLLPEILAHQPATAILMVGGNDLAFGYPASQWQTQYSNLVAQLQANGVKVKHTFQTPRNSVDLTPLRNWIIAHYPASDIIDTWTPFVTNAFSLNPIYDSGDGVHPNDAGHLIIGQIIRTNLP